MGQEWGTMVHEAYNRAGFKLYKKGEWSVLAGIILCMDGIGSVVAVGTGVKCIPRPSVQRHYQLIRDSHAEVLARRAFIAYLYRQIAECQAFRASIFVPDGVGRYQLKKGVSFVMYISQAPCGEATMHIIEPFNNRIDDIEEGPAKRIKKTMRGRADVTRRNVLRTKPGRADSPPSFSHSCSDKLALWSSVGWQGAILSHLLTEPIFIEKFLIGERFDKESLVRAIWGRAKWMRPDCQIEFEEYKGQPFEYSLGVVSSKELSSNIAIKPTSVGQIWFEGCGKTETIVDGKKQGSANTKDPSLPLKLQSSLSTERLFNLYRNLAGVLNEDLIASVKIKSEGYQRKKSILFNHEASPFCGWQESNDIVRNARCEFV